MKHLIFLLLLPMMLFGQWAGWGGKTSSTTTGRPDYIFQSNFISTVGLDTTLWSEIGADIYGANPSGKFTTYAPFVIPTFFDTVSYLAEVSTSMIVVYAGKVNTRWDVAIWDVDDQRPSSYCAEAVALFERMDTQPTEVRKGHINTLIVALKNDGIWAKIDIFYIFAAHTEQAALLNWVSSSFDATKGNAPAFTSDQGFTGNGTTSYLNTNWNPTDDKINYAQNSNAFGVYIRNDVASNVVIGSNSNSINNYIYPNLSSSFYYTNNITAAGNQQVANTNSSGFFVSSRIGATTTNGYRNGTPLDTSATASGGLNNVDFYILARSINGGAANNWSTFQVSCAFAGAGLTANQAASLTTRIETYMDAIGAGVIP